MPGDQIITILTDPESGGTFLTWSLHFLAGHDLVYSTKQKSFVDLIHNPVRRINAHGFQPNQPETINKLHNYVNYLHNVNTDQFHTLYFHNLSDCDQTATGTTATAIDAIKKLSNKIIYLSQDKKNSLYQCKYNSRSLGKDIKTGKKYQNLNEQHTAWIDRWFNKDKQVWHTLSLTEKWDYREFLALNIRPFNTITMSNLHPFEFEHYYIDSFDLYNHFDQLINDLFEYLDLELNYLRKTEWLKIYRIWQQLHINRIQFVYYFDLIIDYIVKGKYFNLERLDLDVMQEAAIQHCIIYRHNLNFKTWQLEKFVNTQQLHSLLEPNLHKI